MATPCTRGATPTGFAMRRRAVTRARAGPRRATILRRRPDAPGPASRRRAERLGGFGAAPALAVFFAPGLRRRASFTLRVFCAAFFLATAFLAADFFADLFAAALAFFFLRLIVIRIAVSPRRAERAIRNRARRRSGRWRRRRRRRCGFWRCGLRGWFRWCRRLRCRFLWR